MLTIIIVTGLLAAGTLFMFTKWGVLGLYNRHRRAWMPPAECYYCLSIYLSLPGGLYWFLEQVSFARFIGIFIVLVCSAVVSSIACCFLITPDENDPEKL